MQGEQWTTLWNDDAGLAERAINDATTKGEGRFHAFRPTVKGTPKWWDVIVTPIRDDAGQRPATGDRVARYFRTEARRAGTRAAPRQRADRPVRGRARRTHERRLRQHPVTRAADAAECHPRLDRRAQAAAVARNAGQGDRRHRSQLAPAIADGRRPARHEPHHVGQTPPRCPATRCGFGDRGSARFSPAGRRRQGRQARQAARLGRHRPGRPGASAADRVEPGE